MGRWGLAQNEDFEVLTNTLTDDFTANNKIAVLPKTQTFILLVDYAQGDEDELQINVAYGSQFDVVKVFYAETVMDINTKVITTFNHRIQATGKYRIPLPVSIQEDQIKISVRGQGSGSPYTGTVTLDFVVDKIV